MHGSLARGRARTGRAPTAGCVTRAAAISSSAASRCTRLRCRLPPGRTRARRSKLPRNLAYRDMYAALAAAGNPQLVRVWNYIAGYQPRHARPRALPAIQHGAPRGFALIRSRRHRQRSRRQRPRRRQRQPAHDLLPGEPPRARPSSRIRARSALTAIRRSTGLAARPSRARPCSAKGVRRRSSSPARRASSATALCT